MGRAVCGEERGLVGGAGGGWCWRRQIEQVDMVLVASSKSSTPLMSARWT